VSGHLGVRLRTKCRIRHYQPCKGAFRNCGAISSLRGSR